MKSILCLAVLSASLAAVRAHDVYISPDYASTVSYGSPVVYRSPVVYQAPVTYHAPVHYVAAAATAAVQVGGGQFCPRQSRSTVIHITDGRGIFTSSHCDYGDSSVVVIGSTFASRSSNVRHIRSGWFGRSSFFRPGRSCW